VGGELVLFVGDDGAEDHHDIEIVDEDGRRLLRRRLPEGAAGIAELHALIADHLDPDADADQVVVGIETDRGPWVQALLAVGYVVYAINPWQASATASATAALGPRATWAMRTFSPSWCAWIATITARSRGTPRWPSTSRWWLGRTSR
jgi:hypothetical protein